MGEQPGTEEQLQGLGRAMGHLEAELFELRRTLLRVVALLAAGMVGAGLVLPVFSDVSDGERVTLRTATAWYTAFVEPGSEGDGVTVALGIGFVGLLLAALGMLWVLLYEVVGGAGRRRRGWLRGWAIGLTVVGSLVPAFLSLVAAGSEPEEGGWGGLLLLVGSIGAAVLVTRERPQDLWLSGST